MKTLTKLIGSSLLAVSLAACTANAETGMAKQQSAAASGDTTMVGGAPMYPSKNIIENAVNSKDHETLVAAVKAAGLVETLQGEGPFMVFAPTDEAFAKLPAGTVDDLLKPENKAQLQKVLTYHVVQAAAMSDAINKMIADDNGVHAVPTVAGGKLLAENDAKGNITLTDENGRTATVTIADVRQSNGVIHVIDTVLLPK
ncbi:fasciclin domain-containing protein [Pelagibius sp. CAU 1746]|uniref:fasciclin domain-containing protein n=1 Tax=Pelagibius sp. CAU 1746 TaxID=3140370 RepID=UPI00325AA18D